LINKKAQTMGLAIITMLGIFLIGFVFLNFIIPEVTTFRIDMNCNSASSIHDGNKLSCLMGDLTIPYFVLTIFSLSIGIIVARLNL
jgi:uncharacterized membrane protein YqjE